MLAGLAFPFGPPPGMVPLVMAQRVCAAKQPTAAGAPVPGGRGGVVGPVLPRGRRRWLARLRPLHDARPARRLLRRTRAPLLVAGRPAPRRCQPAAQPQRYGAACSAGWARRQPLKQARAQAARASEIAGQVSYDAAHAWRASGVRLAPLARACSATSPARIVPDEARRDRAGGAAPASACAGRARACACCHRRSASACTASTMASSSQQCRPRRCSHTRRPRASTCSRCTSWLRICARARRARLQARAAAWIDGRHISCIDGCMVRCS